jgi:hypothetical protein
LGVGWVRVFSNGEVCLIWETDLTLVGWRSYVLPVLLGRYPEFLMKFL